MRGNTLTFSVDEDLGDALRVDAQKLGLTVPQVSRERLRMSFSTDPIAAVQRERILEQARDIRIYGFKRYGQFLKALFEEIQVGIGLLQEGREWPPKDIE